MGREQTVRRKAYGIALCILALILVGLIGTTYGFYTSSGSVDNLLITKGSEVFLEEYFSPDDLWLPGETKAKQVYFGNQSGLDQVIRFKVEVKWFDNKGTPGDLTDDLPWSYSAAYDPAPVVINWTNEITDGLNWTKMDDYYYYNDVLAAQSGTSPTETPVVINSVTFSRELSNDAAHAENFSNKACRITIRMESLAVNADFTRDAWNAVFIRSGSGFTWSKP